MKVAQFGGWTLDIGVLRETPGIPEVPEAPGSSERDRALNEKGEAPIRRPPDEEGEEP